MKTPKLNQRKRDGIWFVTYYENGKRKLKSLGTKDRIEACKMFSIFTDITMPTITPLRTNKDSSI